MFKQHLCPGVYVYVDSLNVRWTCALILLCSHTYFVGENVSFWCVCVCLWLFYQLASWDEAAVFKSSYLDASPSVVEQCWEMERGGREMGGLAVLVSSLLPSGLPETYRTLSKGINSNKKNSSQLYHKVITTNVLFLNKEIPLNFLVWNGIGPVNIIHIHAV